jgi:L-Ala-D/L-Glu epimerase
MNNEFMRPLTLRVETEQWPLIEPFRITNHVWETLPVVRIGLAVDGLVGQGEAAGVYYKKDTPASMTSQIEAVRGHIEAGITRDSLQSLLPPGGARNAVDGALWDLEAKRDDRTAWQMAEMEKPRPLMTTFTCGAASPETMAATARSYAEARAIKLKLTSGPTDADRVRARRGRTYGLGLMPTRAFRARRWSA